MPGLGITAGAHRLWSHRTYKAGNMLRLVLVAANSMAGENSIYTWSRDHRTHHKYSETSADPHNAKVKCIVMPSGCYWPQDIHNALFREASSSLTLVGCVSENIPVSSQLARQSTWMIWSQMTWSCSNTVTISPASSSSHSSSPQLCHWCGQSHWYQLTSLLCWDMWWCFTSLGWSTLLPTCRYRVTLINMIYS